MISVIIILDLEMSLSHNKRHGQRPEKLEKWALISVGLMILSNVFAYGTELPAKDAKVIEAVGIPIFPGAAFAIGNRDVGYRFATSKLPAEAGKWYLEKLPDWALFEEYGGWILYNDQ
ncbi:MAG: hypothetical protein JXB23_17960 [Candidatus Aminicenantes bacterium]|nr:hypothetical protein [Candidatus Aminicenantes bacterium]